MKTAVIALSLFCIVSFQPFAIAEQPWPSYAKMNMGKSCLLKCNAKQPPNLLKPYYCETYCACVATKTSEAIPFNDFVVLESQLRQGLPFNQALMDQIVNLSDQCAKALLPAFLK